MKDLWYADKRDLIKWGALVLLANRFKATRILQIAYYRPCVFPPLVIEGQNQQIPPEVLSHFRDVRAASNLKSMARITVFDAVLEDRHEYLESVIALLHAFRQESCVVFLDPDIGLEPQNPTFQHVLDAEALGMWRAMKEGDVFVIYQHKTNRNGQPWIEPKRQQLATAIGVALDRIGQATGPDIANDVVLFFIQKTIRPVP